MHFELFADQEAALAAVAEDRSVEPEGGKRYSIRLDFGELEGSSYFEAPT